VTAAAPSDTINITERAGRMAALLMVIEDGTGDRRPRVRTSAALSPRLCCRPLEGHTGNLLRHVDRVPTDQVAPAAVIRITDTVEIDSVHWSDVGIAAGPPKCS